MHVDGVLLSCEDFPLLTNRAAFVETLRQLRTPGAPVVSGAVIAVEATLATLLVAPLPGWSAPAFVAALFAGFGVVGAVASTRESPVRCSCFGAGSAALGKRQVLMVPLWIIVCLVASLHPPESPDKALLLITIAALAASSMAARRALPEFRQLRRLRAAIDADHAYTRAF